MSVDVLSHTVFTLKGADLAQMSYYLMMLQASTIALLLSAPSVVTFILPVRLSTLKADPLYS